jgi:hypothetical protein
VDVGGDPISASLLAVIILISAAVCIVVLALAGVF